ncbi:MAG: hypothetical protein ABL986_22790 [Vicinamibacterales bacterium]
MPSPPIARTAGRPAPRPAPQRAPQPAAAPGLAARILGHVLLIAAAFCALLIVAVLIGYGGWDYYRTPLATRGYHPAHSVLRPSGAIGLTLGVAGMVAMLSTLPYAIRKRWRLLSKLGQMKHWLEIHIFFGIVGPVLVTLHTALKFNGLISVGYWLMMAVWASGFVGRYLYVRIPKTIRGVELSRVEVEQHLSTVEAQLAARPLPPAVQAELDAFHVAASGKPGAAPGVIDLFLGELRVRVRLLFLRRQLAASGASLAVVHDAIALAAERAAIARRLHHLRRTHKLFELWHVFHRPLVYVMFVLVAMHVGIALFFGYARLVS